MAFTQPGPAGTFFDSDTLLGKEVSESISHSPITFSLLFNSATRSVGTSVMGKTVSVLPSIILKCAMALVADPVSSIKPSSVKLPKQ